MTKPIVTVAVYATLLWAVETRALPTPEVSLNTCQNAVKTATKAFVANKVAAIGTCLQAVSTQIVKNNAADAHVAAGACVTQFRRINDSRGMDKQLSDKLAAAVIKKCDPSYQTPSGSFPNTHTLADIIGTGAGVSQPLDAENLNAWCSHYGGDGSINSLQEWIACVTAAAECDVDSAIASQYPRAIEWLNLVKPSMQALTPPVADPTKVTDAVAGLDAVKAEIDGPDNDNVVSIQCGSSQVCGNDLAEGSEVCDGTDLHSQSCATQAPTTPYGTLACNAGCTGFVTTGCLGRFVDNGDGTVTDNQTQLVWEKKSPAGSGDVHDANNQYNWSTGSPYNPDGSAFFNFLTTLNGGATGVGNCTSTDASTESGGFAGHCDWRLPSIGELQTIVVAGGPPTIDPIFGAIPSNLTTPPFAYWSATTDPAHSNGAYFGRFDIGAYGKNLKASIFYYVRAVRSGL